MAKIRIEVYSHGFRVSKIDWQARYAISDFIKKYVQFGITKVRGRFQRQMLKVYATATANRSEYWFHVNAYSEFMMHCDHNGIAPHQMEIVQKQVPKGAKAVFKVKKQWSPRDYQIPVISYLTAAHPTRVVTLQTGRGKGLRLDAKLKVPGGWMLNGDVKVGDVLTAWDGGTTKVTGVYPQGIKECYSVTFKDGRKVTCDDTHLWEVFHPNWVPRALQSPGTMGGQTSLGWRTINTKELLSESQKKAGGRLAVRLCKSEQIPDVDLKVSPWIMGALLGDGGLTQSSVQWTSIYPGMRERMEKELPPHLALIKYKHAGDYGIAKRYRNDGLPSLVELMSEYGVMGKRAWEKHIPEVYLHASHQQRLQLLQGLMDTDGEVGAARTGRTGAEGKCGRISYSTTSHRLAKDVMYLVRSLGGMAHIRNRQTYYTYKGEREAGKPSFRVNIRMSNVHESVTVPHKLERVANGNQYSDTLRLGITSVERVADAETQCISVDHPSRLYVTDDFIVTHNTYCALEAIAQIGQRVACVIRGGYVDKWIEDVKKTYDIETKRIMVVRGEKHLRALIALAKAGELDADFIIITSKTMYAFYKAYEQGNGRSVYGCKPHEFYKLIEAGVRLIDEVHEDFHLNFKQDLYTNIAKTISLSATLESKDPFMNRMYDLMFPQNIWYRDGYVRYIDVMSLHYSLKDPNSLNHVARGRGSYSHVEFEKSLIRKPSKLDAYLGMISAAVRKHHIEVAEDGQRVIVFAATIELCTIITDRLSKDFEDKKVARYVSEDNYDVLFENDVICSTLLSAGTAVDIPGLRHVLMTTAIDSLQKNIQALGRLRDLEKQGWAGQTPEFIYLVCDNIPKQVEYHRNKIDAFADKCKSQIAISSGVVI